MYNIADIVKNHSVILSLHNYYRQHLNHPRAREDVGNLSKYEDDVCIVIVNREEGLSRRD